MRIKAGILILFLLCCCVGKVPTAYASAQELIDQLTLISLDRQDEEFLVIMIEVLGSPDSTFRADDRDVWFYEEIDSSLASEPMENVYIVFEDATIVDIKESTNGLNPFNEFEVY